MLSNSLAIASCCVESERRWLKESEFYSRVLIKEWRDSLSSSISCRLLLGISEIVDEIASFRGSGRVSCSFVIGRGRM